jgi:Flp pilus assembly protein TadD
MSKRTAKLSPVQSQQLRTRLGSIMQLIQQGQHAQANASLQPILRKHPTLPDVNHVAAGLSASIHELDRAVYYAQRAVELAPGTPEYLAGLGSILLRAARHTEAIDALSEALSLNPGLTDVLVPLATAQMQIGRIHEARSTFTRVLAANPADLEAANNLALLESDLGYADRAIGIIEDALKHHPEHPLLLDALCMFACYSDSQTPDEVAEIHRRFGNSVQSRVRPRTDHPNTPIRIGVSALVSSRRICGPTRSRTFCSRWLSTSMRIVSRCFVTTHPDHLIRCRRSSAKPAIHGGPALKG